MTSKTPRVPRTKSRALLYGRYSRLGTRDRAALITLDQQFDEGEAIAKRHGLPIVGRYQDENRSGATLNRPGFEDAMRALEAGEADTMIVSRLSRFARSVPHTFDALERIAQANGRLIAGDLDIDTSTPTGKLILTVMAAFVEFERELKRADFAEATSRSLDNGVKIGRAPVGYVKETRSRLVRDDELAPVVAECFAMRARRAPWREVREYWHSQTGEWKSIASLASMIRNRTYLGELVYGDRVEVDVHEAIVDRETFDAAQSTDEEKLRAPRGDGALLAGVVYCASCGRRMTPGGSSGHGVGIYACQNRRGQGSTDERCPAPVTIGREKLDAYVTEQLLAWAGGAGFETSDDDVEIERLTDVETKLVDRRTAIESKLVDLDVDLDTIASALAKIDDELAAVRDERAAFLATKLVAGVRSTIRDDWNEFDMQERRHLISGGVERIVVSSTRDANGRVNRRAPIESRVAIEWRRD